jgi:hypothetical protein
MKYIYLILLFSSINISAQNNSSLEQQKKNYGFAVKILKENKEFLALHYFRNACFLNSKNQIGIKSKRIIDSLIPKYQKIEALKWIGTWKSKQLKDNRFNYEKIKITYKNILFYDKTNDTIASRVELIKHRKYQTDDLVLPLCSVKFTNKEVWEFYIETDKNGKRLFPVLRIDSNKVSYFLNDERGLIRNKKDRIEALKKEIRTYYIEM